MRDRPKFAFLAIVVATFAAVAAWAADDTASPPANHTPTPAQEQKAATPPPPTAALAAPATPIARAAEAVGPEPMSEPAQAPAGVPAPRTGVIIDPASMAPDDPGPQEQESKPRRSWLYANE